MARAIDRRSTARPLDVLTLACQTGERADRAVDHLISSIVQRRSNAARLARPTPAGAGSAASALGKHDFDGLKRNQKVSPH
jgi:hypothetical protein